MSDQHTHNGSFGESAKELASKAIAGLKAFGNEISDASRDMVHSARANSRADDTKKEIDEEFRKLGELAYQNGNLSGKMQEIADKIRQLYEKLQNIEIARNDPAVKIGSQASSETPTKTDNQ